MRLLHDLSGKKFGKLTAICRESHITSRGTVQKLWKCVCDCGEFIWATSRNLKSGYTHQCATCRQKQARQTKLDFYPDKKAEIKTKKRAAFDNWSKEKKEAHRKKLSAHFSEIANHRSKETQQKINESSRQTQKRNLVGKETDSYKRLKVIYQNMISRCIYDTRYAGVTVCNAWQDSFLAFYEWALQNGYAPGLTLDRIDNYQGYSPTNCRWVTMQRQSRNRKRSRIYLGVHIFDWADLLNLNHDKLAREWYKGNISTIIDELIVD